MTAAAMSTPRAVRFKQDLLTTYSIPKPHQREITLLYYSGEDIVRFQKDAILEMAGIYTAPIDGVAGEDDELEGSSSSFTESSYSAHNNAPYHNDGVPPSPSGSSPLFDKVKHLKSPTPHKGHCMDLQTAMRLNKRERLRPSLTEDPSSSMAAAAAAAAAIASPSSSEKPPRIFQPSQSLSISSASSASIATLDSLRSADWYQEELSNHNNNLHKNNNYNKRGSILSTGTLDSVLDEDDELAEDASIHSRTASIRESRTSRSSVLLGSANSTAMPPIGAIDEDDIDDEASHRRTSSQRHRPAGASMRERRSNASGTPAKNPSVRERRGGNSSVRERRTNDSVRERRQNSTSVRERRCNSTSQRAQQRTASALAAEDNGSKRPQRAAGFLAPMPVVELSHVATPSTRSELLTAVRKQDSKGNLVAKEAPHTRKSVLREVRAHSRSPSRDEDIQPSSSPPRRAAHSRASVMSEVRRQPREQQQQRPARERPARERPSRDNRRRPQRATTDMIGIPEEEAATNAGGGH